MLLQNNAAASSNTTTLTTATKAVLPSLGPAPNDIYQLESEIASHHENAIENENKNESVAQSAHDVDDDNINIHVPAVPFTSFDIQDITAAKQALDEGQAIDLQLPSNVTPCALLGMAGYLGLDRTSLQHLFQNTSSTEAKRVADQYVCALKQKYAGIAHIEHPYAATACGGYLYRCTRIDALPCDRDLSAKLRICMDLDFVSCVENDDAFADKFRYELCSKVFKCPVDGVHILDVRAGSVIVIVAGVSLITLAAVGLFTLSVKLYQQRNRAQQDVAVGSSSLNSDVSRDQRIDSAPILKPMDKGVDADVDHWPDGARVMSSHSLSQPLPSCSESSKRRSKSVGFFANLVGKLKYGLSQLSVTHTPPKKEAVMRHDLCDDEESDVKSEFVAENDACIDSSKYSVGSSQLTMFSSIRSSLAPTSISTVNGEMLQLSVNDLVWVQRKKQLWAATVVTLTQSKATVEYENGGPYLFSKQETIALSDPCLMHNEPGMIPIEGCVQISKSNGGYIKAWRTGLQRPMADM